MLKLAIANKVSDKEFTDKLKAKFKLSPYELNCLIIEVKAKFDATTAIKANTEQRILDLEQDIICLNKIKERRNTRFKRTPFG